MAANYQSLYDQLAIVSPLIARLPAKPAITFARILERVTVSGRSYAAYHDQAQYFWCTGEPARLKIQQAWLKICDLYGFDRNPQIMQLAIVMLNIMHKEWLGQIIFPSLHEYALSTIEAYCISERLVGPDLTGIVANYMWNSPLPINKRMATISIIQHWEVFAAVDARSIPSRFIYPDDFIIAFRAAHPDILSANGPAIDDFIMRYTMDNGWFKYKPHRSPTNGLATIQKIVSLVATAGLM